MRFHFHQLVTRDSSKVICYFLTPIQSFLLASSIKNYKLREHLTEDLDYILVPEKSFTTLKEKFGVENKDRDVIARPVVIGSVLQREPFVEVYPLKLKVCYSKLMIFE